MQSSHHDAIVIGASTAGVTLADALAAAGQSVLLIDRAAAALAPRASAPAPLFRLQREDLGRLEHFEGESAAWPIGADDLTHYYALAEGRIQRVHADVDPALRATMHRLRASGVRPFATPMGILPSGAPASVDSLVGTATRLDTDASGRNVTAVIVESNEELVRASADAVILTAGAIGSAALLLRSASDAHPHGLANGSGVVGQNLVRRSHALMLALMKRAAPVHVDPGFTIQDYYLRAPGWRYPCGHVRLFGATHHENTENGSPYPGPCGTRAVHSLDFLLSAEGLPHPENRVTLRRDGKTVVQYRPTNLVALRKLAAQLRHTLDTIGAPCVRMPLSLHPEAEEMLRGGTGSGTVRMGTDPARSAVDPQGRAHQLGNLWVSDASVFPSGSALEPTLTLIALALRTAEQVTRARLQTPALAGGRAA